jgi:hypothetical protein
MLLISWTRSRPQLRILGAIALVGLIARFLGARLVGLGDRLAASGPFVEVTWRETLYRWVIWFTRQLEHFMRGDGCG